MKLAVGGAIVRVSGEEMANAVLMLRLSTEVKHAFDRILSFAFRQPRSLEDLYRDPIRRQTKELQRKAKPDRWCNVCMTNFRTPRADHEATRGHGYWTLAEAMRQRHWVRSFAGARLLRPMGKGLVEDARVSPTTDADGPWSPWWAAIIANLVPVPAWRRRNMVRTFLHDPAEITAFASIVGVTREVYDLASYLIGRVPHSTLPAFEAEHPRAAWKSITQAELMGAATARLKA